jgi:hypothetical protein
MQIKWWFLSTGQALFALFQCHFCVRNVLKCLIEIPTHLIGFKLYYIFFKSDADRPCMSKAELIRRSQPLADKSFSIVSL